MDDRLAMSIANADGTVTRWGPDEPDARDIPADLTFDTATPGGFRSSTCSLYRDFRDAHPDQGLFDDIKIYGPGGRTAWEGRMTQFPVQFADGFMVQPGGVGWAAHLKDDPSFREIYVDRDITQWQGPSVQRRLNLQAISLTPADPGSVRDDTTGQPSLATSVTGAWTAGSKPAVEGWYSSLGIPLGSLYYAWKKNANVNNADANWFWETFLSTDDVASSVNSSGNLIAAGPASGSLAASGASKFWAIAQLIYQAAGGTANAEYAIYWTCLAVYGAHGLTKQGTASATNAQGFYIPDMVRDIVTRAAPLLTIGTIDASTFVCPHAVFSAPTTAEDAITLLNAYMLWDWLVYDDRTFSFQAPDPDRLTWRARLSNGANLNLTGDDAENQFNGVIVTFTDPLGIQRVVGPPAAYWQGGVARADATDASLVDTSATNPVNAHGIPRRWGRLDVSFTTTTTGAIQLGAIWLAEHALPQRRGQMVLKGIGSVQHPTEGNVPTWRVRAGDFITVGDIPGDTPRRIIETTYSHSDRSITLSLDNTSAKLDAILQRIGVGLVGVF